MAESYVREGTLTPSAGMREPMDLFIAGRREQEWLMETRKRAWKLFLEMEWPTPQDEEWRRTDITSIDFSEYKPDGMIRHNSRAFAVNGHGLSGKSGNGEGLQDGYSGSLRFSDHSDVSKVLKKELEDRGVRFTTIEDVALPDREIISEVLLNDIKSVDNRVLAYHHSLLDHGAYLYIPPFVEVQEPFLIDFIEPGKKALSSPHVIIFLDTGARARVIQRMRSGGRGNLLCNAGLSFTVGESASLDIFTMQNFNERSLHFVHGRGSVQKDGRLHHFEGYVGGRMVKSRIDCSLDGSGSDVLLSGLYFSQHEQHMDIRSVQRHNAPSTVSRALYKGAVKDGSWSIYQGLIEVSPKAAKTDAYLTDRNLLLNDGARADSIPSLRIDHNDVKCSHGSTTGRIDEEEVYYLMSRGLTRSEAEMMIVFGYFEEVLGQVPDPIRHTLQHLLKTRIRSR